MSMTNGGDGFGQNPGQPQNQASGAAQNQPQFSVLTQYMKDFSFENPNAPRSLTPTEPASASMQVDVAANPVSATDFEVELRMEGKTEVGSTLMFSFELIFAGLFRIQNIPQESMGPLLMIECPRLLFPFAREVVASAVRNGGFPHFFIEPIDFVALYRQKMMQAQPPQPPTPVV